MVQVSRVGHRLTLVVGSLKLRLKRKDRGGGEQPLPCLVTLAFGSCAALCTGDLDARRCWGVPPDTIPTRRELPAMRQAAAQHRNYHSSALSPHTAALGGHSVSM